MPPPLDELQPGFITTVAGVGLFVRDYGDAREAAIAQYALDLDAAGSLYIAQAELGTIVRVRAIKFGAVLAPSNAAIQASASGNVIHATVFDAQRRRAPGVTDAMGIASVTCQPNCVQGTYAVTAQPLAASSTASVPLVNERQRCRPARRSTLKSIHARDHVPRAE